MCTVLDFSVSDRVTNIVHKCFFCICICILEIKSELNQVVDHETKSVIHVHSTIFNITYL